MQPNQRAEVRLLVRSRCSQNLLSTAANDWRLDEAKAVRADRRDQSMSFKAGYLRSLPAICPSLHCRRVSHVQVLSHFQRMNGLNN